MVEVMLNRMLKMGGMMMGAGIFATNFCFVVDGGERAIIMDAFKGLKPRVHGEGIHFKWPFIQSVKRFEVRTMPFLSPSQTGTRDLQTVSISLRFLYRPMEDKLPEILNNIGADYDKRILPSIGNEVLKSVVAQYNAEQLISQREKVSDEIRASLSKRAREFDIILDDVAITDLQFSPEFARAIEQKQVAQQNAERAKFIVAMREEEKKATILKAQGEAAAAQLVSEAISESGPGLVAIRKIEAAGHIAEVLKRSPNVTFLSGNTLNMLNLGGGGGL